MLKLYQSNKVERLLAQLVALLLENNLDPLASETIVVENPGLAHWLKMQLAHSLGIAANIEFPMPSRFFWQVQRQLMPDLAQESVFTKASLRWLILEGLNDADLMARDEFELLRHYIQGPQVSVEDVQTDSDQPLRAYRLANTIADLYDQYLVHRPDWIEAWQNQQYVIDDEPLGGQVWQGIFWHYLINKVKDKGLSQNHRANMVTDFMEQLEGVEAQHLPKRVIFFGFTSLPKHQVDALQLLSKKMDVHLLTPNPCQYYWGDVLSETVQAKLRTRNIPMALADAGNDLLASFGQLGQDFQRLLIDVDNIQDEPLFLESEPTHVLAHIQNQILNLQQPSEPLNIEHDDSLNIIGCHSPMREIEVLHDHLLDVFERTDLSPQDIVVMIPDVASYAPFIDAVFNAQPYERRIPYSVSDRPLQAEHPILNGVNLLLSLPQSRMQYSEVITLLEIPALYRAYDLQEKDIPKLKHWLTDAGVRWGFDENSRKALGLPEWKQNTWLYGFKRLLMGYAVQSTEPVFGIVPVEHVEGLEAALLGPLIQFVNDLQSYTQQTEHARHCTKWSPFFRGWLQHFFAPEDEEQSILEHVYDGLDAWVESVQAVQFEQDIEYDIFSDGIKQGLQKTNGSQHFMVGKVNFCTLLPMRSIPFKMVAVLGLNDSEYPRSVIPNSLDLMRFKHRLGDRSRRNEDRFLFLEAILSARESLWLSYRSKSQSNDEPLTPSVVLAELLDYLNQGDTAQAIVQQHPLQPFNPTYFNGQAPFYSYNKDWLAAISDQPNKELAKDTAPTNNQTHPAFTNEGILLEQLIRFYQHSSKYYLNNVLDISLFQFVDDIQDQEPFELDGLDQFRIKSSLLNDKLNQLNQSKGYMEGLLPFGEIGEQQWHKLEQQISPLLSSYDAYAHYQQQPPLEVNLQLSPELPRLLGWQYQIFDQYHLLMVPSKFKAKHLVQLIIEQACLSAMGKNIHSRLMCQDQIIKLMPIKTDVAREYLSGLLTTFMQGNKDPLPLLIETAWQLVAPLSKGARKSQEDKALGVFYGSSNQQFGVAGECEDIHVRRCHGDLETIPEVTLNLAHTLFDVWLDNECLEMEALS